MDRIVTTMHYGYIETTMHKHELHRVYRPFHPELYILMPIESVEKELELDKVRMQYVKEHGYPLIPLPNNYMDADELRDYHNDDSLSGNVIHSDLT